MNQELDVLYVVVFDVHKLFSRFHILQVLMGIYYKWAVALAVHAHWHLISVVLNVENSLKQVDLVWELGQLLKQISSVACVMEILNEKYLGLLLADVEGPVAVPSLVPWEKVQPRREVLERAPDEEIW